MRLTECNKDVLRPLKKTKAGREEDGAIALRPCCHLAVGLPPLTPRCPRAAEPGPPSAVRVGGAGPLQAGRTPGGGMLGVALPSAGRRPRRSVWQ